MSEQEQEAIQRVLALAEANGEFVLDVDGFTYWQPRHGEGHLAAHQLRWLADELDRRNRPQEEALQAYEASLKTGLQS